MTTAAKLDAAMMSLWARWKVTPTVVEAGTMLARAYIAIERVMPSRRFPRLLTARRRKALADTLAVGLAAAAQDERYRCQIAICPDCVNGPPTCIGDDWVHLPKDTEAHEYVTGAAPIDELVFCAALPIVKLWNDEALTQMRGVAK